MHATDHGFPPEVLNSLFRSLKLDLHWLDQRLAEQPGHDAALRGKCQDMSRLIESAAGNVARISERSSLSLRDLWAALERQARNFVQTSRLELEWDLQAGPPPELSGPAALAVFRIFDEMLSNVGRHAQASRLTVRIAADEERLRLTVEDNGNGASPEAFEARHAHGVAAMRERARELGGHIAIASEVGHGSAFTLVLPLRHD